MKKILLSLVAIVATMPLFAQMSKYDLNAPFGWCTCVDYLNTGYNMTGGEGSETKSTITLTATGEDQGEEIKKAIQKNDIIIFDGSKGDFLFKTRIQLSGLHNKTIVGINNARLCTMFYITKELKGLLNKAGVSKAKTEKGTGGTLTNGMEVAEQREFLTRQTLINAGYEDDQVRNSGIFSAFKECSNIIIRNLNFVGPGPIDVGGNDLLTLINCNNVWVDHCSFTDGIDGNFDISNGSNLITVSWCTFAYTDRAYDHMNSNLIGSNDHDSEGLNKLNVTYANCMWGNRCRQRMPMARNGIIHLLNNYYNCSGNDLAINPRHGSQVLVEGISAARGVTMFKQKEARSVHFSEGTYLNEFKEDDASCNFGPQPKIPYKYNVFYAGDVSRQVGKYAGATLADPLKIGK